MIAIYIHVEDIALRKAYAYNGYNERYKHVRYTYVPSCLNIIREGWFSLFAAKDHAYYNEILSELI